MVQFECKPFGQLSTEELYHLLALRQEVFVVEQDCVYQDLDYKDQNAWHLLGWDTNKQLIAYLRLLPAGVSYPGFVSIGRVITAQSVRRLGIGQKLMTRALEWSDEKFRGIDIKISAQVYLLAFYRSFGFETTGAEYLEDGIPHIAMIRKCQTNVPSWGAVA